MEPRGATATGDEDDLVFIPLPTMQARIPFLRNPQGLSNVMQITVKVTDGSSSTRPRKRSPPSCASATVKKDDFTIRSQEDLIATVTDVSDTLTILLGSIAGISLSSAASAS